MLGKMTIYSFMFLGIFGLLMASIPSGFFINQGAWDATYGRTDQKVKDYFSYNDITVYNQAVNSTVTHQVFNTSYTTGLPANEKIEVWWGDHPFGPGLDINALQLRHLKTVYYLGFIPSTTAGLLLLKNRNNTVIPEYSGYAINKARLLAQYESSINGSAFYGSDDTLSVSIVYQSYKQSWTQSQSWDNNKLQFLLSYQFNASATSVNMWSLLGELLTFQSPKLGISGFFGSILDAVIAIPMTITIVYILYKVISGLVPFLSGGSGD